MIELIKEKLFHLEYDETADVLHIWIGPKCDYYGEINSGGTLIIMKEMNNHKICGFKILNYGQYWQKLLTLHQGDLR